MHFILCFLLVLCVIFGLKLDDYHLEVVVGNVTLSGAGAFVSSVEEASGSANVTVLQCDFVNITNSGGVLSFYSSILLGLFYFFLF
jgi:hypothetical protein